MIDQKVRFLFHISQPTNIPKKWFSTQNGLLDIMSQMRQTKTMEASDLLEKSGKNHGAIFLKHFEIIFQAVSTFFFS